MHDRNTFLGGYSLVVSGMRIEEMRVIMDEIWDCCAETRILFCHMTNSDTVGR